MCRYFSARNIFSLGVDEMADTANYWLAEHREAGPDQGFTLYLGCKKTVVGALLRNTHDAEYRDRGTKKFQLLGSANEDGPWQKLLEENLEDSRNQSLPPVLQFMFDQPAEVSFIKFDVLEYWGEGGGLQYIEINSSTGKKKSMQHFNLEP